MILSALIYVHPRRYSTCASSSSRGFLGLTRAAARADAAPTQVYVSK